MLLMSSADYLQSIIFQKILSRIISKCQTFWIQIMFVCLFELILYVRSTMFQLNRDRSSWVEPVLSSEKYVLLKDHNAVTPVRLKPAAPPSRVKHSTTEPLRSLDPDQGRHSVYILSVLIWIQTVFKVDIS